MYRIQNTYGQNLQDGPRPSDKVFQDLLVQSGSWYELPQKAPLCFFDSALHSELGVAAGPLLDSRWIKRCADLGYGILSYKTVRTQTYPSHPLPNIAYLDVLNRLSPGNSVSDELVTPIAMTSRSRLTITNSFGMPSQPPKDWMADMEIAKGYLHSAQLLAVSVVGTPPCDTTPTKLDALARDYARCGAMAREAGADLIEANLSCPNTSEGEGDLYTDPQAAETVMRTMTRQIPNVPLGVKLGYFDNLDTSLHRFHSQYQCC